jgi:hypothetical protein
VRSYWLGLPEPAPAVGESLVSGSRLEFAISGMLGAGDVVSGDAVNSLNSSDGFPHRRSVRRLIDGRVAFWHRLHHCIFDRRCRLGLIANWAESCRTCFLLSGGQGWLQFAELGLALVLSALIGLEREMRQKSAGRRAYIYTLVGLASALIILISKHGFTSILSDGRVVLDPSRMAARIVSSIEGSSPCRLGFGEI